MEIQARQRLAPSRHEHQAASVLPPLRAKKLPPARPSASGSRWGSGRQATLGLRHAPVPDADAARGSDVHGTDRSPRRDLGTPLPVPSAHDNARPGSPAVWDATGIAPAIPVAPASRCPAEIPGGSMRRPTTAAPHTRCGRSLEAVSDLRGARVQCHSSGQRNGPIGTHTSRLCPLPPCPIPEWRSASLTSVRTPINSSASERGSERQSGQFASRFSRRSQRHRCR